MTDKSTRIRFGSYQVDLRTREIWNGGLKLKLTGQPFEILEILLSRPGQLVTREELQKKIWGPSGDDDQFVDAAHGLNAAIRKLREALEDSADNPRYIETLHRRGYRFLGEVTTGTARNPAYQAPDETEEIEEPASEKTENIVLLATQPTAIDVSATPIPPVIIHRTPRWPIFLTIAMALFMGAFAGMLLTNHASRLRALLNSEELLNHCQPPEIACAAPTSEPQIEREPLTAMLPAGPVKRKVIARPPVLQRVGGHLQMAATARTIISGAGGYAGPQFSPDGKRIAFMTNRTGPWQIFVSNADGSDVHQISSTESAGTPRWSPDGRSIAFDAPSEDGTSIYVARVEGGGQARKVAVGLVPSFSRDGKWIYFASDRTGDWQVWKAPANGHDENAVQVTTHGGFAALQSKDGYIYYSKTRYSNPEIWRVPLTGGEESLVSNRLRPRTWSSWAVTENGILFVEDLQRGKTELSLYDPKEQQTRDLAALPTAPFWMGSTADGRKVVINDAAERQISLLEDFR